MVQLGLIFLTYPLDLSSAATSVSSPVYRADGGTHDGIDLMSPFPSLPFLDVKHDPVLDLVEKPATLRIRQDDLDVWIPAPKEGRCARKCTAGTYRADMVSPRCGPRGNA